MGARQQPRPSQGPRQDARRGPERGAPSQAPGARPQPNANADKGTLRRQAEQWPAAKKLAYLRDRSVGDCRRCRLAETRRNLVFGVGNPDADMMFVGEAPGAEEDRRGEPFVGAAGQRLDAWLHELGLQRSEVYIANVLKCRPPGNRDPHPVEIQRCSPFLHAQIRAIQPRVLVALGRFAGCLLLDRQLKMYQMRGSVHRYREPKTGAEFPLVVTYHPSYVLRRDAENMRQARGGQRGGRGGGRGSGPQPDQRGPIKSEGAKVLADLQRAVSLFRAPSGGPSRS